MKFERNDKYTTIAIYALLVIICSIVFHEGFKNLGMVSGFVGRVAGYLQPITNGIVFAFLLNPLLRFLEERLLSRFAIKPLSRRVAGLILTYLLAFTFVGLFSSLVAPQIFSSIQSILNNLQIYFKALEKWYLNITSFIGSFGESTEFERLLIGLLSQLLDSLRNLAAGASDYFYTLLPGVLSATQRVTTSIVNLFLGVIVSIYLLMDREKLFAQLKKILRAFTSDRSYRLITDIALDAQPYPQWFCAGQGDRLFDYWGALLYRDEYSTASLCGAHQLYCGDNQCDSLLWALSGSHSRCPYHSRDQSYPSGVVSALYSGAPAV
jgi:predicted PurR-regulated permease PerM